MQEKYAKHRRSQAIHLAVTVVVLVATGALGSVAGALNWDGVLTPGSSWDDGYTIRTLDMIGTLEGDALHVVQDVEVEWHEPRRGLIVAVDHDGDDPSPDNIEVESATQEDVWHEVERNDDVTAIHLGEENDHRPLGVDHYRVSYQLEPVLVPHEGRATLRWDTFGDEVDTLIEQATVGFVLPQGDHELDCVTGARGEVFTCDGEGPTWQAEDLRPGRGMTVEAQLDPDLVPPPESEDIDLQPLQEVTPLAVERVAMIAAFVALPAMPLIAQIGTPVTRRRRRRARELIETTGVTYTPPAGVRPLAGAFIVQGKADAANEHHAFAAWLLDLQQRDLVEAGAAPGGFWVRRTGHGQADDDAEAAALDALTFNGTERRSVFTADDHHQERAAFDKAWRTLIASIRNAEGIHRFTLNGSALGYLTAAVSVAAGIWFASEVSLAPGATWVVATLWALGVSHMANAELRVPVVRGRGERGERWRQLEGLRRFIAEAHADQIDGLAANPNVPVDHPYLELLPWVVALGYGDHWSAQFPEQIRAARSSTGYFPVSGSAAQRAYQSSRPPQGSGSGSGVGSGIGGGGISSR